ncbi:ABC-2 family transporter protein [bacterium]|nr:ABC-2 family transporter protein [bacterium]
MRGYRAILSARFRVLLQYRAAAIAGLTTQLFWGLIRMMIFIAFYESGNGPQPMTMQQTINYVWLSQALFLLVPWRMDRDVSELIRTGNVAYELVRPLHLYWMWYARAISLIAAPLLLRVIPIFVVARLFFGLELPATAVVAGAFLLTMLSSIVLGATFTVLFSLTQFWTISGQGLARVLPILVFFMSGMIVPLPLLPDWFQPIIHLLPFQGLIDLPFQIYIGLIPPTQAGFVIAQQLTWAGGLMLMGHLILKKGLKRVVIQGG